MVFIELITGKAGCGKSFMLSKYINIAAAKTNRWIVLAYTHSAINNIEQYVVSNYPNVDTTNHFMTIHKYFHINFYDKDINVMNRGCDYLDYMFIDEFTLVSIYLFSSIWPMVKAYVNKLVLCGDYRQLKPVNSTDKIYYDSLKRYLTLTNITVNNVDAIQHFDNIILSLDVVRNNVKKVINLTKQYRANSNVNKFIESLCFGDKPSENIDKYIVKLSTVINLVENNNYVFIASTYRQLRKVNDLINKQGGVSLPVLVSSGLDKQEQSSDNIETITIKLGEVVRITETYDEFQNGELYEVVDIYDNCLIVKSVLATGQDLKQLFPIKLKQDNQQQLQDIGYYPILPEYLLTFHKSQGLTINNVIISLDNIFDFTMLYTGISRSRNNILFYTDKATIDYSIFEAIKTNYTTLDTLFNKLYVENNGSRPLGESNGVRPSE